VLFSPIQLVQVFLVQTVDHFRECLQIVLFALPRSVVRFGDGAHAHPGFNAGVLHLAFPPTACWSLELAEKINNYLNI
jgi:hypothetical protein